MQKFELDTIFFIKPSHLNCIIFLQNTTDSYQEWTAAPDVSNGPAGGRRKRSADLSVFTSPTAFIGTLSDRSLPTDSTVLSFKYTDDVTGTDREPTVDYVGSEMPVTRAFSVTWVPPATSLHLTSQTPPGDMTSDSSPLTQTASQVHISTQDARRSTRSATAYGVTGEGELM